MASLTQLYDALKNADAAGATDDARMIADEIYKRKSALNPEQGAGLGANAVAESKNIAYGVLGAPVDAARTVINAATQPNAALASIPIVGPILNATQQLSQAAQVPAVPDNTPGGSKWLAQQGEKVGITDPAKVQAVTLPEKMLRSGMNAAALTMAPELLLSKLKTFGIVGDDAVRVAESVLGNASSGKAVARNAMTGGAAGAGAELGNEIAPEPVKPLAALLGALAGGAGFDAVGQAAVRGARTAATKTGEFFDPMRGQEGIDRATGRRLARGLDATPEEAITAIDTAKPTVSGAKPTLSQVTSDRGAATMEAAARRHDPLPFEQRAAEQEKARVARLKSYQKTGGAEDMGPALDAHAKRVDDLLAKIDATEQARGEALAADIATGRKDIATAGEEMQGLLQTARDAKRASESLLHEAVDPDGTLVTRTNSTRDAGRRMAKQQSPLAKPITGEEKAIVETIDALGPDAPYRDLVALKSRIGEEMRAERRIGRTPRWGRLSQYDKAVAQDLKAPAMRMAKEQAAAIKLGDLAPEDSFVAKIRAITDELDRNAAAFGTADAGTGAVRGGTSETGLGSARAARAAGLEPGRAASGEAVQGSIDRPATVVRKNGEEFINTRGNGAQYHGSSVPITSFDEGHYNNSNIYGNGFYTTDAVDAAVGYQKKGGGDNPHLYQVGERAPVKTADMDAPISSLPPALQKAVTETDNLLEPAYASLGAPNPTLKEVLDELRGMSAGEGWSRDDVHEAFDLVRELLSDAGYGGMTHMGGGNTGTTPHQVKIYFEPKRDLSLTKTNPSTFQNKVDEDVAARLAAANQSTIERVNTFDNGALKPILKRPSDAQPYTMKPSAVPGKIFQKGPAGTETVGQYRAAVGDAEALPVLEAHAIDDVARVATRPDGTIDPRKLAKWRADHAEALRAFPALDMRLANATKAAETAGETAAVRRAKVTIEQKSLAAKLAGATDTAQFVQTIASIFKRADGVTQMQKLRRALRGDPAAHEGLRKAVVDHLVDQSVTEATSVGVETMAGAKLASVIRDKADVLKAAGFTHPEIESMAALADEAASAAALAKSARPAPGREAQILQDVLKIGTEANSSWSTLMMRVLVLSSAHSIAPAVFGGPVAGAVSLLGAGVVNLLRARGLQSVDELFHEALLDPALARKLLAKVNTKNVKPVVNAFRQQLVRSTLGGAIAARDEQGGVSDPLGIR